MTDQHDKRTALAREIAEQWTCDDVQIGLLSNIIERGLRAALQDQQAQKKGRTRDGGR